MSKYNIIVTRLAGLRRDDLHELDQEVSGIYTHHEDSKDAALDRFHNTTPIKVLEDFDILVEAADNVTDLANTPEAQDMDFIAEAARDFMDIMIVDNEQSPDPDTAADIKKIAAALERLGR